MKGASQQNVRWKKTGTKRAHLRKRLDLTLRCCDRVRLGNSRVLVVKLLSELQKPKQHGADVKSEHKVTPINGLQKPCIHGRLIFDISGESMQWREDGR